MSTVSNTGTLYGNSYHKFRGKTLFGKKPIHVNPTVNLVSSQPNFWWVPIYGYFSKILVILCLILMNRNKKISCKGLHLSSVRFKFFLNLCPTSQYIKKNIFLKTAQKINIIKNFKHFLFCKNVRHSTKFQYLDILILIALPKSTVTLSTMGGHTGF